jgi:hypothetical protein
MEAAGLRYAYNDSGDIEFIEWATRNRMASGIYYKPYHAICIVDLTKTHAVLLDNNRPEEYEYVPRNEFVNRWRNEYGGFAWTVVYQPPPGEPKF